MTIFSTTATIETIMTERHRFVSAITEFENKLVTLLSVVLLIKLPPKYLNKSKCEKRLNIRNVAPFAIKVMIMFTRYSPAERQTANT